MHQPRLLSVLFLILISCSNSLAAMERTPPNLNVHDRSANTESQEGKYYQNQVQPILNNRCTVCHGCYDAPCQLKLSSPAGIARGATKALVYDALRLREAEPTRLNIDASNSAQWRKQGFYPVLNEGKQNPTANREASLLFKMLELKKLHPLPSQTLLPESFTLGTKRKQSCSNQTSFEKFAEEKPLWGMPYGLPQLSKPESETLTQWIDAGAPLPEASLLPSQYQQRVAQWENFFNGTTLKQQLVNRYIYEHLFLGHLYFDDLQPDHYFELVRSYTPPGQPIKIIPTRRPYDDPGKLFYYRLRPIDSTILAKNHMPYALSNTRMERWELLFYQPDYPVTELPAYTAEVASNPFEAFKSLPVSARYRFMLDEAQFTIMGFIKGPVCRGQIALNVIRDRFWVVFENPDISDHIEQEHFLAKNSQHLRLPAESGSNWRPVSKWLEYSVNQLQYLEARYETRERLFKNERLNLDLIWDGDGVNSNSALTIIRHFDSASVLQGFVGDSPQTAWVVDYPILERIHYLLVAGFDVFGNVNHQLLTRLYMDFLRMESEFNFLTFLPPEAQESEWDSWYEGAIKPLREYLNQSRKLFTKNTALKFSSNEPKQELFIQLQKKLAPSQRHNRQFELENIPTTESRWLRRLTKIEGKAASLLPQVVHLAVTEQDNGFNIYTILHDNAHSNVASLIGEDNNRRPERDRLTVIKGIVGDYPGAYWRVEQEQLPTMVQALEQLDNESHYYRFMNQYGIRRTDPDFWQHSDKIHEFYRLNQPIDWGLLDYNRLENR